MLQSSSYIVLTALSLCDTAVKTCDGDFVAVSKSAVCAVKLENCFLRKGKKTVSEDWSVYMMELSGLDAQQCTHMFEMTLHTSHVCIVYQCIIANMALRFVLFDNLKGLWFLTYLWVGVMLTTDMNLWCVVNWTSYTLCIFHIFHIIAVKKSPQLLTSQENTFFRHLNAS